MSSVIITRSCGTQVPIQESELDTNKFRFSHMKNGTPVYVLKYSRLRLVREDSLVAAPIPEQSQED